MKQHYTVRLRTAPLRENLDEKRLRAIRSTLDGDRSVATPAISFDPPTRTITLAAGVEIDTSASEAPGRALMIVTKAFGAALVRNGLPAVHPADVSIGIDRGDPDDRDALLSGPEVAGLLGVTRQRVQQLASMPGRFPGPVATFGTVSAWRRGDVENWIAVGNGSSERLSAPAAAAGLTALAAAFGVSVTHDREPAHRRELVLRLVELANAGDPEAVEFLEKNPELAFKVRGVYVEQVDAGPRSPGVAVGRDPRTGRARVVHTRSPR